MWLRRRAGDEFLGSFARSIDDVAPTLPANGTAPVPSSVPGAPPTSAITLEDDAGNVSCQVLDDDGQVVGSVIVHVAVALLSPGFDGVLPQWVYVVLARHSLSRQPTPLPNLPPPTLYHVFPFGGCVSPQL